MKYLLIALAATSFAAQAADTSKAEQAELRAECAKSYSETSTLPIGTARDRKSVV